MASHKKLVKKQVDIGFCGDHYCNGHTRYEVSCECGRQLYKGEYPPKDLLEKHRIAVALGEE